MNKSTMLWIALGLGVAYVVRKSTQATAEKIQKITDARDKAAGLTRIGDGSARPGSLLDASGNLLRPIGADLSSRIGAASVTVGLGGLGESFSAAPENDGGMFGGDFGSGLRLMQINPYGRTNAARVVPWWKNTQNALLNASTPTDPYHLQPLDRNGDPTNPQLQTSLNEGRPERVDVASYDTVEEVAQEQPYVEPGDKNYGNMTATDFLSNESETYDEDPGAMIGLRQN